MTATLLPDINLDDPQNEWIGTRHLDPAGRVMRHGDHYVRAVYRDQVPFFQHLLDSGVIDALTQQGLILEHEHALISHARYGMLLRAKAAPWRIYGARYTFDALKDSALAWLEINRILSDHGLQLYDAHFGNFVFYKNRPHWVDLGSIVPPETGDGLRQFLHKFVYPLILFVHKPGFSARRAEPFHTGVTRKAAMRALGRHGRRNWNEEQSRALWKTEELPRQTALAILTEIIGALHLKQPDTTWSGYRNEGALNRALSMDPLELREDRRDEMVLKTVMSCKPTRILDVGANDGFHSILYARQGCEVLALDRDEFAINKLYSWARSRPHLKLSSTVDDFATTLHQASTVVSLALTHHLAIHGKMDFDFISRRYAQMSTGSLIVEFMPNGIGSTVAKPDPLPAHYSLDAFLSGLRRFFDQVEVVAYERPAQMSVRTLIKCTGRNSVDAGLSEKRGAQPPARVRENRLQGLLRCIIRVWHGRKG